jgi:hypothetical protein
MHDLLAPYALNALDAREQDEVERHLARCARCRLELGALQEAAAELAYTVVAPAPPPALYERIAEGLRPDNVVPLRGRRLTVVAAAIAVAAVMVLAFRVSSLSESLDRERQARRADARLADVLTSGRTRTFALDGNRGSLVVAANRQAALIARNLAPAPDGHVYEAWVLAPGGAEPAGTFSGGPGHSALALARPLPPGATVGVTLQARDDLEQPSLPVLFGAKES